MPDTPDHVDRVRAQWRRERPDLDTQPVAVVARLGRAARFVDQGLADFFAAHNLSRADWDVLASLRRSGAPYSLSPTTLYRGLMRTSGAMSQRLESLEQKGLIERALDPADRRGVVVKLTAKGRKLVDDVSAEHVANERRLLAPLSRKEQNELAGLLKKLLLAYESEQSVPPGARKHGGRRLRGKRSEPA
jgi:DNA-binding MarR family transcriptional regulator